MADDSSEIDSAVAEQHRLILETITDYALCALDADGRIVSWSAGAERLSGCPAAEVIGRDFAVLFPEPAEAARRLRTAAEVGRSEGEGWRLRKNAPPYWAGGVLTRLVGDDGTLRGFVDVARDETVRRRAEDAHRREEARLRGILDSAMDAIVSADASQRIILFNSSAERTFGYTADRVIGRPLDMLIPERFRRAHAEHVRNFLRAGETRRSMGEPGRLIGLRADGSEFPLEATISRVESDGRAVLTVILRDVTARRSFEEQIRLLWHAVEQSPASVIMTDAAGTIDYVNRRFTEVTGYTSEEARGQNPRMLNSGAHPPELYRELWATLSSGREWHGELQNRRKNGSVFWERAHISPVMDESGRIVRYIAIKEDITTVRGLEAQQRQSQKMEAIGRLAGGVAHDFNNVLTAIHGFAQLLRTETEPDEIAGCVDAIETAAERGALLTRQLLTLSRQQVMQPQRLDLNDAIDGMQRILGRLLGGHIRIRCRLAPEPWPVRADPTQLEQVMMNVAINARDAMPAGGELLFETRNLEIGAGESDAGGTTVPPGRYVMLAVTDTGQGMDPEVRRRIFEPFFTTKAPGEGSGLGLSTVYGIVQQTGGVIGVESEPGQGTTIRICLPAVPQPAEDERGPAAATAARAGGATILLVEDEESVRSLTVRVLEGAGYSVLSAGDGARALDLAARLDRRVDLLLTDVVMPSLGGKALADGLGARWPGLAVLFMSGYSGDAIARHGVLGSDVRLLEKPFTPAVLLAAVHAALEHAPAPPREPLRHGQP